MALSGYLAAAWGLESQINAVKGKLKRLEQQNGLQHGAQLRQEEKEAGLAHLKTSEVERYAVCMLHDVALLP